MLEEDIVVTEVERRELDELRALLPEHIRAKPEAEQSEFLMHILRQRRKQVRYQILSLRQPSFQLFEIFFDRVNDGCAEVMSFRRRCSRSTTSSSKSSKSTTSISTLTC